MHPTDDPDAQFKGPTMNDIYTQGDRQKFIAIAIIMTPNISACRLLISTFATLCISSYGLSKFISTLQYNAVSVGTKVTTQAGDASWNGSSRGRRCARRLASRNPSSECHAWIPRLL